MSILSHTEVSEICNHLGESNPSSITQIHGGNIHNSWKLEFKQSRFFVKKNNRNQRILKFEESCLYDLQKYINSDNLIVPKVIAYLEINNKELLLMEWIDMNNVDQAKLGKGLGEMHLQSNKLNPKRFGYPINGYIGTINQIKGWEDDWIDCFINLRIKPQLLLLKDDFLDINNKNKIILKIKSELAEHFPESTLVHGDLWSGNMGIGEMNKGVIFDPACWWADNEVDIAMTRLFGNFQNEFYEEYSKIIPNKKGFENRITIYNFYHILNHAIMFGGSYFYQVRDYIKKIFEM